MQLYGIYSFSLNWYSMPGLAPLRQSFKYSFLGHPSWTTSMMFPGLSISSFHCETGHVIPYGMKFLLSPLAVLVRNSRALRSSFLLATSAQAAYRSKSSLLLTMSCISLLMHSSTLINPRLTYFFSYRACVHFVLAWERELCFAIIFLLVRLSWPSSTGVHLSLGAV